MGNAEHDATRISRPVTTVINYAGRTGGNFGNKIIKIMYVFKNIKTVWLALFAIILIAASCNESQQQHQAATASQDEVYTCPMHPQIISDKPGNCPICG